MQLAAVVLAAGLGTRLRPLTDLRPKALCPVNNVALIDANLARAHAITPDVAVNVHHHRDRMVAHLDGRAHLSIEVEPLGTAGAIGNLKRWIDGRDVVVVNADSWHQDQLGGLLAAYDGESPHVLVVEDAARPDFDGRWRFTGASVLPWRVVERLPASFAGLSREVFGVETLTFVASDVPFFDCGTVRDYHAANMYASGGTSVVGDGARVLGTIERCVLWPDVTVHEGELLVDAVRARDDITVSV